MPGGFVHLDVRSYFSLKEGALSPEALARRAAELQMPAVAIADRDGLYGVARFVEACEREGVHPILGASVTVREAGSLPLPRSGRKPVDANVVLLARDAGGYANLCRLITDAHMTGERDRRHLQLGRAAHERLGRERALLDREEGAHVEVHETPSIEHLFDSRRSA